MQIITKFMFRINNILVILFAQDLLTNMESLITSKSLTHTQIYVHIQTTHTVARCECSPFVWQPPRLLPPCLAQPSVFCYLWLKASSPRALRRAWGCWRWFLCAVSCRWMLKQVSTDASASLSPPKAPQKRKKASGGPPLYLHVVSDMQHPAPCCQSGRPPRAPYAVKRA